MGVRAHSQDYVDEEAMAIYEVPSQATPFTRVFARQFVVLWERRVGKAHRKARREDLAAALDTCGLHQHGGPIFGVQFVAYDAHHWAPETGGTPAIIVPYFEDGCLLDLVAVGLKARTCRTRTGICTVLGADWLERARDDGTPVRIFADPLEWLRNGRRGAVIVDWRAARYALADVPALACGKDKALANRIDRAMRQPVHMPRLIVSRSGIAPVQRPTEKASQAVWAATPGNDVNRVEAVR